MVVVVVVAVGNRSLQGAVAAWDMARFARRALEDPIAVLQHTDWDKGGAVAPGGMVFV